MKYTKTLVAVTLNAGWGAIGAFSSYSGRYFATDQWNTLVMFKSVAVGALGGLLGFNPPSAVLFGVVASGLVRTFNWD